MSLKCHFDADGWLQGPIAITHMLSPNRYSSGFTEPARGLVQHTEDGFTAGTDATFMDSSAKVSAFFGVSESGAAQQFLPVGQGFVAWAEEAGNPFWRSCECEDKTQSGTPMTQAQMVAFAQILEACSAYDGFPLQITDDVNGTGLICHSDGGAAWGGHYNCLMLNCTDVLTPEGWLPLEEVTLETQVASYAVDSGILTFARPLAIVPPRMADTIELAGFRMTPDHRMFIFRSDHPSSKFIQAGELEGKRTNWLAPHSGMLPTEGLGIGGDLMRLLVWVQADGHYMMNRGKFEGVEFHLRRERKVQRVSEVLEALGKDFSLRRRTDGSTVIRVYGIDWLRRNVLRHLDDKRWKPDLWKADQYEFAALDEDIVLADGAVKGGQRFYFTPDKRNADAIQALYVTHGRSCSVYATGAGQYDVNVTFSRAGCALRDRYVAESKQVTVGCLTTQDGTILARQNGRVMVVGNCPGDVRKAQRPQIVALAIAIRAEGNPVTTPPKPAVKAATVPIELLDDSVVIHATVNGKPVEFVLDTGDAIGPTFTSADATRLGLVKGAPFGVEGAGGASSAFETTASITFDSAAYANEPSAIDDDLEGQSLLGLPFFLSRTSVLSFDFPARTLTLTPLHA